jgi:hypothetical protein
MTVSNGGSTNCVPSDSKGNTWTGLTLQEIVGWTKARIYFVNSTTPTVGASHTFRCDGDSDAYPVISYVAASSAATGVILDLQNGTTNTEVNTISPGAITPTLNDSLIVAVVTIDNGEDITVNGGFTTAFLVDFIPGTSYGGGGAFLAQTMTAARNPAFSWTTNAQHTEVAIASFHLAAIGVPASKIRIRTR